MLAEKAVQFTAVAENYWEKREGFMRINISGSVPFLAKKAAEPNESNLFISGTSAIIEYLEDRYDNINLIFGTPEHKAEIRRMIDWFNVKFYQDVMFHIVSEKIIIFFKSGEMPNTQVLSAAKHNLSSHLDYLGYLLGNNGWVGGRKFSAADVVAAANISVLDYLGMIPWQNIMNGNKGNIKEWYSIVKSRPSFRSILQDLVPGFVPPAHYKELDF